MDESDGGPSGHDGTEPAGIEAADDGTGAAGRWLRLTDAADRAGIDRMTAYRWHRTGVLAPWEPAGLAGVASGRGGLVVCLPDVVPVLAILGAVQDWLRRPPTDTLATISRALADGNESVLWTTGHGAIGVTFDASKVGA